MVPKDGLEPSWEVNPGKFHAQGTRATSLTINIITNMVNWNKRRYTQEEFTQAWLNSKTIGEVARKLGCNHSGGGYLVLRRAAQQLNLPVDHLVE